MIEEDLGKYKVGNYYRICEVRLQYVGYDDNLLYFKKVSNKRIIERAYLNRALLKEDFNEHKKGIYRSK